MNIFLKDGNRDSTFISEKPVSMFDKINGRAYDLDTLHWWWQAQASTYGASA